MALSADGLILASSAHFDTKLWNAQTGQLLYTIDLSPSGMAMSANGLILASGHLNKTITLLDIQTGKLLHTLKGHFAGYIHCVALSADGLILASSNDHTIKLWRVKE